MQKWLIVLMTVVLVFGLVSPTLSHGPVSEKEESHVPFTVVFKSSTLPANAAEMVESLGGKVISSIPEIGVIHAEGSSDFAKNSLKASTIRSATPTLVQQRPDVKSIAHQSEPLKHEDTFEDATLFDMYQWDIQRLTNNGETFAEHSGSHDVVVGVIDSGIDLNHPDVLKNLLPGSKNFVAPGGAFGVDKSETGDVNDVQDRMGHGTHVSASIAANGAMLGVAPNVGHKAYRVFGAEGGAQSVWIMDAIVTAANDGVDVINMSLGGIYSKGQVYYTDPVTGERFRLGSDIADYVAYQRAARYAESKGTLIVAAAGNDGINAANKKGLSDLANEMYGQWGYEFQGASVYAPANIPNVVTVSSTGPEDELALYSTYGPGYVDVAAPGGNYAKYMQYLAEDRLDEYLDKSLIVHEFAFSAVPVVEYTRNEQGLITDYTYAAPGYSWMVGTSMAAPKVSAMAALLFDEHENLTPRRAKVLLQQSAEPIGTGGYSKEFGHGLSTVYNLFQ